MLALSACGGGGGGGSSSAENSSGGGTSKPSTLTPPPVEQTPLKLDTAEKTSDFLARATFGPAQAHIDGAMDMNASDWLVREFARAKNPILPDLVTREAAGEDLFSREHTLQYWKEAIHGSDQLRQRMIFALSQIMVVSDKDINNPLTMAHYIDILADHAFGNYRDLMQDITYSPAMAEYLTYLRNKKGDAETGRMPDENYARELLQLFTIGLVELNMDGTPKLVGGEAVEVYTNEDIVGLARVFTGLSLKGAGFWDADDDGEYAPLIAFEDKHSSLEKTFLGTTITAGSPADNSITQALDTIFAHPNLAPFVSRQLIQRFTSSAPSSDYVLRVASAFEAGTYVSADSVSFGAGQRGDLEATLAAVLLDEQFFDDIDSSAAQGKVREPVLKFVHWARAFSVSNVDPENENNLLWNTEYSRSLSQAPFRSNSVFNFYRPGYIAPGSASGDAGLTAPELQIVNEGAVTGYNNFMMDYVFDISGQRDGELETFKPDYSDEVALADTPEVLADHLDALLLSGRMNAQTRASIIEALELISIDETDPEPGRLLRVKIAVYMAVVSPEYAVSL